MDHLDPVRDKIRRSAITAPPEPWSFVASIAIGGLTELGFANDSELLLVLSSQGRGIIDCSTGEKVARDRDESNQQLWFGKDCVTAIGFGPLEGSEIRVSGLVGGGLPIQTHDGWNVDALAIDWPDTSLLLLGKYESIYQPSSLFWKLAIERETRAFGFSYTGRSLLYAISSGITIWKR
jgi:hypothetical protein